MFRIRYINGDVIDTAHNVSGVLGNAFHKALDIYFKSEGDRVADGLKEGMSFIEAYPEGFVKWSKNIPNRQSLTEKFALIYNARVVELSVKGFIDSEMKLEQYVDVEWRGERLSLPIKLKGYIDRLFRDEEGRLIIEDDKSCFSFSNPDKIDGKKIIQAIHYYFLVYAETGEEPYKMRFTETKYTNASDGHQTKAYDIIYGENELFFDFYLRFYSDVVRALSGEQVFLPNIDTLYDNEVSVISYVHRLDIPEEKAKQEKIHRVNNITDVLKKKVASVRNMKALEGAIQKSLAEYKNINFDNMKDEEKISTKLMEHGIVLHYENMVDGNSYHQYRFSPSIGVKMKSLQGYSRDIEQALGISGVRIIAPIPDTTFVGVEVPKKDRRFVALTKDLIGTKEVGIPLGINSNGEVIRISLDDMPHMLVAGATGSGKSVFLNSIIYSIIMQDSTTALHLIDPKMVELTQFEANAKTMGYTVEDALAVLLTLSEEMEKRYKAMRSSKSRNYKDAGMKQIVCVIDEFGDLVLSKGGSQLEDLLIKIAQKGRAAGIHLIISTQRPDSKIVTGLIKANFPTKVSFAVSSEVNSRIILDEIGAEKLMGKGDGLISHPKFIGIQRIQAFNF